MKELIDKYVNQGFKIFPCNPDKTPSTLHGFKDAHSDIEILYKQFYKPDMLIGLPTGNFNGIVVIDFDLKDGRILEELKEELKTYGELPETLRIQTPSGGEHWIYKIDQTRISSSVRFFEKTLPIDIRANGGYICAADYKKYFPLDLDDIDDFSKSLTDLPEWIENYRKTTEYQEIPEGTFLPESEIREIRSALAFIDSDDRDMWVKVGMALKNTGSSQAKGIWLEWSMKSDKFDPVDAEKKWKTFKPNDITIASIFHFAKNLGWVTTYENTPTMLSDAQIDQKIKEFKTYEKRPFPKELLNPPGLVGEIAEYMNTQSIREQPILSLAASLTFCGALMGQKFQDELKMRTNIYCMGIGETGCGKENARTVIKRIVSECNDAKMKNICMVENIASETAIYNALTIDPSPVFLLDEIGIFLKSTQNNQASYLAGVPAALLKLFTSASVPCSGKSYADTKKQITIDCPNLCIYGTATPEQFFNSLSKDNVEQGLIGRMLIFESEDSRPPAKRHLKNTKPPKVMIDNIMRIYKQVKNVNPHGNVSTVEIIDPLVVPYTKEAEKMMWNFTINIDETYHEMKTKGRLYQLYTRCTEIAKKIALIVAIGDSKEGEQPIIRPEHVDYATKISRYLIDNLHDAVESKISDNNQEKEVKKMLNLIRSHKKMSQSEITRKFQHLKSTERKDVLHTLIESGHVEEFIDTSSGGKAKRVYIAI
jgi:hypothetical protein